MSEESLRETEYLLESNRCERWLETPDDVVELITFLRSPARNVPVVIVSPSRHSEERFPVPPDELAEELGDVAEVYALSSASLAWELDAYPDFRTYGGAVRVVGSAGGTSGGIIRTDGDVDTAYDRIVTIAEACKRKMPKLHAIKNPESGDGQQDVRAAGSELDLLNDELARERKARQKAEERAAEAGRQLTAARGEIKRLRSEIEQETAPLFSDAEEQFRDEVQRTWLRQVVESERATWPLRGFQIGAAFLGHLDFPQASREKILEVVVDVLTRRAYDMPSRSVRAHGDGGPAGTNGQITRTDGATGYRCNIKANSPQAPRLLFWELTDGTVELALAGLHDAAMPNS